MVKRKRTPIVKIGSAEYKRIEAQFYAKLAATGHHDLEFFRDEPDTTMAQHHLYDRRTAIRGEQTGLAEQAVAIGELPNHSTSSSLLQRIILGLLNSGLTESNIRAGLPRTTQGSVHKMVENVRKAAIRLARSGDHIPQEDE